MDKSQGITAWVDQALAFVDTASWPGYRVALDISGDEGNGQAVAQVLANTTPLIAVVRAVDQPRADMTIVVTAERSYLIDELGVPVSGSLVAAMLAESMLVRHPRCNYIV